MHFFGKNIYLHLLSFRKIGFKARKLPKTHVSQSVKVDQLDIHFSSETELIFKKYPKTLVAEANGRTLKLILIHLPSDFQFTLLSQKSKEISFLK